MKRRSVRAYSDSFQSATKLCDKNNHQSEISSQCNIHVKFPAGCPMMVAGPTGCGKTSWVQKLLSCKDNFTQPVRNVLYCYGVYQPRYNEMARTIPNVTFHKGLPNKQTIDELKNPNYLDVLVLDDLMEYILDNIQAQTLFTKYCHHYNVTTIFITQNVLAQGRCARNISLNTLMLIMFQNHRDRNQALTMAKQQSPRNPDLFLQAFEDATKVPFGYLVIDCTPECDNSKRWRTCIFKDNKIAPLGKCYIAQRLTDSSPVTITQSSILESNKNQNSSVIHARRKRVKFSSNPGSTNQNRPISSRTR